jgi:DNA-binding NarL/FixJ family response regulator
MRVVGEHELLNDPGTALAAERPDVTLLDIDRRTRDFVPELITRLAKKTRVIALTTSSDSDMVSKLFWSGAKGLVGRDQAHALLIKAIQKVDAGEVWLERSATARLLSELLRGGDEAAPAKARAAGRLTLRERQLIVVVAEGLGNSEIADRLRISEATVRNHLTSIFKKLGLHSRFELLMYAINQGLVKPVVASTTVATSRGPEVTASRTFREKRSAR